KQAGLPPSALTLTWRAGAAEGETGLLKGPLAKEAVCPVALPAAGTQSGSRGAEHEAVAPDPPAASAPPLPAAGREPRSRRTGEAAPLSQHKAHSTVPGAQTRSHAPPSTHTQRKSDG
ncbi:hypothetical protein P7K49_035727, partial [Saguinus oedipus]